VAVDATVDDASVAVVAVAAVVVSLASSPLAFRVVVVVEEPLADESFVDAFVVASMSSESSPVGCVSVVGAVPPVDALVVSVEAFASFVTTPATLPWITSSPTRRARTVERFIGVPTAEAETRFRVMGMCCFRRTRCGG